MTTVPGLPTPPDPILLARIQEWADALVASYAARWPNDDAAEVVARYSIEVEPLRKYWRIVQAGQGGGGRSVHAFVDPTNGDVLKAAGWKAPAKGVRYNLLDDDSFARMVSKVDPFGGYLYAR